jgi:hypothetical protein
MPAARGRGTSACRYHRSKADYYLKFSFTLNTSKDDDQFEYADREQVVM